MRTALYELLEIGGNKGFTFSPNPPTVILMTGLQGSGKTTTTGKLATYLKNKQKKVLIVAADLQRLAAVEQLRQITTQIEVELYEDEGLNFNYEKGKYSTISIKWSENDQKLTIGERKGEFDGMPQERIFTIVFASETKKVDFNFDDYKGKEVKYNGKSVQVEL